MRCEGYTAEEAEAGPLRFASSYNLLPTLIGLELEMDPEEWLKLLGRQWSGCDNFGQYADELWECVPFQWLCESPLSFRHLMMRPEELAALDSLPETVTVWRGCYANNKRGWSWSLSEDTAGKFPTLNRYSRQGEPALIVRGDVRKDEILALKTDRDEAEVVAIRPKIRSVRHLHPSRLL